MPRTVSASEAKQHLGAILRWAAEHKDEVIIEGHGEPKAVLMPFEEYQAMQAIKESTRRAEALARLRELRETVLSRNRDLTEEEGEAIADRLARDVVDSLVKKGKIKFAR